jgi:hypothetical protein
MKAATSVAAFFPARLKPARRVAVVRARGLAFTASADGTRVETVFDAEAQNPPEMQQAGWQAILDNYRKHIETAAPE